MSDPTPLDAATHQRMKRLYTYIGTFRACHIHQVQQAIKSWQKFIMARARTGSLECQVSFRTNALKDAIDFYQKTHYFIFVTDLLVENGMIRGSNEHMRTLRRLKRLFYSDHLFPLLQEQRKLNMATRKAQKPAPIRTPAQPVRRPRAVKAPAPGKPTPGTHSIEWFETHLIGTLRLLAEYMEVSILDVVNELSDSAMRENDMDVVALENFVESVVKREKEVRRQLILSAAAKLSDAELKALNIGPEARDAIADDDAGMAPSEDEDDYGDDNE